MAYKGEIETERQLLIAGAAELSQLLNAQLDDAEANTVILTREQALLALGLIDGAREILKSGN